MPSPSYTPAPSGSPAPELGLRIAELPKKTRSRAEKLAAFIRDEFRALNVPVGDATQDAAALKRLANDPSVSDERLEALEKATSALATILQGKETLAEASDALPLAAIEELLEKEDLTDTLPNLRAQIAALAEDHETLYGYTFRPEDVLVPREAIPRMLLGLKEGILIRPLVMASPTEDDIARLQLDPTMTMIEHRIRSLAARGMEFVDAERRIATWKQLRAPVDLPLWASCQKPDGTIDASHVSLAAIYQTLPPPDTLGSRAGTPPRLLLIGRNDEKAANRVLADGADGTPTCETLTDETRSAKGALEARCRFLSPEAALLAAGISRDGATSTYVRITWGWVGGIAPDGRVAYIRTSSGDVGLDWDAPEYLGPRRRVLAS